MRRFRELQRTLAACTTIAGLAASSCGAQAPPFDGAYSVAFAGGALTLTFRTLTSGEVAGRIDAGAAVLELNGRVSARDGHASVAGILTGPGGRSDFTFQPAGDGVFSLTLTPHDAMGAPRRDQTSTYIATRIPDGMAMSRDNDPGPAGATPGGAMPPEPGAQAGGSRDARLVGLWSTQVIMSSPAGSVATQLRMQIREDGVMLELGSRSIGDVTGGILDTGTDAAGDHANWRTEGDVIWISYAGSQWIPFARFHLSGSQLLLTYLHDGSRQVWSRSDG